MAGERCGAVVLAAGEARRFGSPKLLMPFGDSTVLGSVVEPLVRMAIAPVVVVGGRDAAAISESLESLPVRIVHNPDPAGGMVSSVRVGVEVLTTSLDRFLIVLGDQPRISVEGVSHLITEHVKSARGIAIPTYRGRRGHPIVFDIGYRREILALTGGETLRDLIAAHCDDIVEADCDSDAYVNDIDTREEYEHELRRLRDE